MKGGSSAAFEKPSQSATTPTASYPIGGGGCAGAPTEKERMIQQLMQEAASLRQRERDYKALQD